MPRRPARGTSLLSDRQHLEELPDRSRQGQVVLERLLEQPQVLALHPQLRYVLHCTAFLTPVNIAVLGAAGYFGYQNRNKIEAQDKKLLGAAAVGIVTILGGERYVHSTWLC